MAAIERKKEEKWKDVLQEENNEIHTSTEIIGLNAKLEELKERIEDASNEWRLLEEESQASTPFDTERIGSDKAEKYAIVKTLITEEESLLRQIKQNEAIAEKQNENRQRLVGEWENIGKQGIEVEGPTLRQNLHTWRQVLRTSTPPAKRWTADNKRKQSLAEKRLKPDDTRAFYSTRQTPLGRQAFHVPSCEGQ